MVERLTGGKGTLVVRKSISKRIQTGFRATRAKPGSTDSATASSSPAQHSCVGYNDVGNRLRMDRIIVFCGKKEATNIMYAALPAYDDNILPFCAVGISVVG